MDPILEHFKKMEVAGLLHGNINVNTIWLKLKKDKNIKPKANIIEIEKVMFINYCNDPKTANPDWDSKMMKDSLLCIVESMIKYTG